jgi:hypothetical protein
MRQMKTRLGRKGWTLVVALCLLSLLLAPMAASAKKKTTPTTPTAPTIPQTQTLDQILSGLPNGVPFKILAQAIRFVEGEVEQLQQQVTELLSQSQSIKLDSGFGTSAILSDVAPATQQVRIEVSFFRTDGTPPAAGLSYIMYAVASVASPTEINFIYANDNGIQAANNAVISGTPTTLASITGLANLVAITGTGGVTFELVETGTTAGTYFVKITK